MTTPPHGKKPAHGAHPAKPEPTPAAKPTGKPGAMPPPAQYKPTVHDKDDTRVHGRMKSDEGDPRLRCPKDSTYMEKVMVGSIEIDRCASCGAMWFDALELEKILEAKDAKAFVKRIDIGAIGRAPGVRALGTIVCPRDRSPLIRLQDMKQSHIEELGCTVCGGVLLDKGELKDLSEFTLKERVRALVERWKGG